MAPRKKYHADSPFLETLTNAKLSEITKRVYLERWKTLLTQHEKNIFTILTKPKDILAWIKKTYPSLQTQKSYISAVLAMFKHNEGLKHEQSTAYQTWYDAFQEVHTAIEGRYRKNEPTEKQVAGYVPFPDIVAKRDTLTKGSDERLLLSFYTYIPPLRCDLNEVYITDKEDQHEDYKNFLVLQKTAKTATLVLTEFKTARTAEQYRKDLPKELVEELLASLQLRPRSFVFADRHGEPYRASSYTKWANRILQRVFGRALTVSLIRHAYINTLDFNTLTVEEKEAIAKDMAHTTNMQDRYRLIFK